MDEPTITQFFPTEVLKRRRESKPITAFVTEDGRDPNPIWDEAARSVWPATREKQTAREALADVLMWAINDDTVLGAAPNAGIAMARIVQRLMGNTWMSNWVKNNKTELRKRIITNKQNFGGVNKMFKKLFS